MALVAVDKRANSSLACFLCLLPFSSPPLRLPSSSPSSSSPLCPSHVYIVWASPPLALGTDIGPTLVSSFVLLPLAAVISPLPLSTARPSLRLGLYICLYIYSARNHIGLLYS